MKILILGVSGMLGSALFRLLSCDKNLDVFGTVRHEDSKKYFEKALQAKIISKVDAEKDDSLLEVLSATKPNLIINCVGLIKQISESQDPIQAILINSLLPHRLTALSKLMGARLIHFSTDCVFSGNTGGYKESDAPDANDIYGRSKLLGEVYSKNAITIRTSIIGHELYSKHSLLCWFLSQPGPVMGYRQAIFSGLPTVELARIIRDFIIPNTKLCGLYHVSARPINKYDLLKLIARVYKKSVEIYADDTLVIDRSLESTKFLDATGYSAPEWPELVNQMHSFK